MATQARGPPRGPYREGRAAAPPEPSPRTVRLFMKYAYLMQRTVEDASDREEIDDCDRRLIQLVRWTVPLKRKSGGTAGVRLTFAPPPVDAAAPAA